MLKRVLLIGLLVAGAVAVAVQAALASQGSASPSIRVVNFKVTVNGPSKTYRVAKGGTFDGCNAVRRVTKITTRYVASGMSAKKIVTVAWSVGRVNLDKTTQPWGTPANGLWAWEEHGYGVSKNGKYVIRFVSGGKLLGMGSIWVLCGGVPENPTPP